MTRPIPLLVLLALAGPVAAQSSVEVPVETVAPDTEAPAEAAPAAPDADGAYGVFAATAVRDLIGMDVLESSGADVGEIEELVQAAGTVQAVVGVGGFLGFGEHDVAIPLSKFVMTDSGLMLPDLSEAQLRGMAGYDGAFEALPRDITVSGEPIVEPEVEGTVPAE